MNKPLHIVFQITNFLRSNASHNYELLDIDKLILIFLATYNGPKGIFPSVTTLSEILQKHRTNIMKSLNSLAKKGLIKVVKNVGKSNHYDLSIPCSTSSAHATSSADTTSSAGATTPVALTLKTSSASATLYNNNNNRSRERGKTSLSISKNNLSHPVDNFEVKAFIPSDINIRLAKTLGINLKEEIESFMCRHKREKSQYEFAKWINNAFEHKNKKNSIIQSNEIKSNVIEWGPGHPDWERLKKRKG